MPITSQVAPARQGSSGIKADAEVAAAPGENAAAMNVTETAALGVDVKPDPDAEAAVGQSGQGTGVQDMDTSASGDIDAPAGTPALLSRLMSMSLLPCVLPLTTHLVAPDATAKRG